MPQFFPTLPLLLSGLTLAVACAPVDEPSPSFGNAVRQNMAAQVINPDPHPEDLAPPEMDGERTRDSLQRYREDKVKRPQNQSTTTLGNKGK